MVTIFPIINRDFLLDEDCEQMLSGVSVQGNGNFSTNNHSFNSADQDALIAQLKEQNEMLKEQVAQLRSDLDWCHNLINALRGLK